MLKLVIDPKLVNDQSAEELCAVCPFDAFAYDDGALSVTAACKMCRLCEKNGPIGLVSFVEYEPDAPDSNRSETDISEWRGVAVFAEQINGAVTPVVYELLGKARQLADAIAQPVYALLIGSGMEENANNLLCYGADKVFVYDDVELRDFRVLPWTAAITDFAQRVKPGSVLVGATNMGRSLAPRVAARLGAGLTADCTRLEMRANSDLVQIRPAFGGNIMAQIISPRSRPQFCTVRYKVFSAPEKGVEKGEVIQMSLAPQYLTDSARFLSYTPKTGAVDLSDANAIVALGRGIKSQKDIEMCRKLAEALGAQLACTRPLIESGWFGPKQQIGLSGRTVAPDILITLGISGSVQFAAGMQNSKRIIAINKDENAPIFSIAHHGLVGDLYEIVPRLIDIAAKEGRRYDA